MDSRKAYLRGVRLLLFAALALPLWTSDARAAGGPKNKGASPGRPAFTLARTPEERRSLFEAWKKQHRTAAGSSVAKRTESPTGQLTPYVGRASMVINTAGTIVYTRNFLGSNATCDPNIEATTIWTANAAFASGAVVRPSGSFSQPNGF